LGKRGKSRHPAFDASDPLLDGPVAATLDLHGMTGAAASAAVRSFLEMWRRRQPGAVVHIITGKGRGSAGAPVLRGLVKTLLQGELRQFVAEWSRDEAEGGYKVSVR
jgi:DNA-nicking Smr family endonuclease